MIRVSCIAPPWVGGSPCPGHPRPPRNPIPIAPDPIRILPIPTPDTKREGARA